MLYPLSHRALQRLITDLAESTKALCGLASVRRRVPLLHYRPGRHLWRELSTCAVYQQTRRKVASHFREEKQHVGIGRSTTGLRFYQPEQSRRVRCNLLCQFPQQPRSRRYRVKQKCPQPTLSGSGTGVQRYGDIRVERFCYYELLLLLLRCDCKAPFTCLC